MSTYGICLISIMPVRRTPVGTSELVTQLLFGETYSVEEQTDDWLHIRADWDAYEGWINASQHHGLDKQEYKKISGQNSGICTDLVAALHKSGSDVPLNIVLGSTLTGISENTFSLDGFSYHYEGSWENLSGAGDVTRDPPLACSREEA